MNAKVPNPYEKDTAMYFDNTGDGGIRCVGAALSIDSQTHVIICAPDIVALKRAWKELNDIPLDVKKAPILLYKYGTQPEELKPKISELKTEACSNPWYWYYNPKYKECFIEETEYGDSSKYDIRLGDAKKCSKEECLQLLRSNRIPRSEISEIEIFESIDGLIPF